MKLRRTLYRYWAVLLFLAVVLQVGLAGYGAFYTAGKVDDERSILTHDQFDKGWELHAGIGWGVVLGGVLLLVFALLARVGRPWTMLAAALALLFVLQVVARRDRPRHGVRRRPPPDQRGRHPRTVGVVRPRAWTMPDESGGSAGA